MANRNYFHHEAMLALGRIGVAAAAADGPEEALWCFNRALPGPLGDPDAVLRPNAFREPVPPAIGVAAAAFMRMPDGRHHVITAPVNFPAEQHHELVDIQLGHPGVVAASRRPLLLRDTSLHHSFVKILQTFRAGSAMFAPLLWHDEYLGVMICANAARATFGECDLAAFETFGHLAAAYWMAQGGPAWLASLDTSRLPMRDSGT